MSPTVRQGLLIAVGGLALVGIVTTLARRRMISIRYAFGWLAIALLTIIAAAAASLVNPIARTFDMTGTAVFLAGATMILVAIAIQLSISVSGLQNQLRDLSESHALLTERVEQLERRTEMV
jgi:Uncharacterized conserved protein (DUF2304)